MTKVMPLVIIGAGDHGRGTLEIVRACNLVEQIYDVRGFLDDSPQRPSQVAGLSVLGGTEIIDGSPPHVQYVIAIAQCRAKQQILQRLESRHLTYARLVHPAATVAPGVELGAGAIVGAGAVVAYDTRLGEHVTVNLNATVGHDCQIGSLSTIAPGANVAGRVTMGPGCDIGLNATVVRGVSLGGWSVVGPGSVVLKGLPANSRVFGNPARTVL